jgi:hypothetical protein
MVDHPERWSSPFTQVGMRRLWTYNDGDLTVKGYRLPSGTARAGSWVLVDQATGNVHGVVPPGEFSRRFRPVDLFADVPSLATYLGTVTTSDGTAHGGGADVAVNLVRPTLADAERLHAAQRATAEQRASFETFTAQHGLNARSLDVGLALGTPRAQ